MVRRPWVEDLRSSYIDWIPSRAGYDRGVPVYDDPGQLAIFGQPTRRLSENRKSTAEKWALARFSHYYRQIE